MKIKVYLFYTLILFLWEQPLCAQRNNIRTQTGKKQKLIHQLEYGLSYVNFLQSNKSFDGWAGLFYRKDVLPLNNYYYAYKAIINEKHLVKLSYIRITPNVNYQNYPYLGLVGLAFETINLGYGYILPIKKVSVSLVGQLSYRYRWGETAVFGYLDPDPNSSWNEPVEARLEYNSIGFLPSIDMEYFITKNVGLGANLNINYYPFENAKLKGEGISEPSQEFIASYKPKNLFLTLNFKLAYKFSLSNFKKKK